MFSLVAVDISQTFSTNNASLPLQLVYETDYVVLETFECKVIRLSRVHSFTCTIKSISLSNGMFFLSKQVLFEILAPKTLFVLDILPILKTIRTPDFQDLISCLVTSSISFTVRDCFLSDILRLEKKLKPKAKGYTVRLEESG